MLRRVVNGVYSYPVIGIPPIDNQARLLGGLVVSQLKSGLRLRFRFDLEFWLEFGFEFGVWHRRLCEVQRSAFRDRRRALGDLLIDGLITRLDGLGDGRGVQWLRGCNPGKTAPDLTGYAPST